MRAFPSCGPTGTASKKGVSKKERVHRKGKGESKGGTTGLKRREEGKKRMKRDSSRQRT